MPNATVILIGATGILGRAFQRVLSAQDRRWHAPPRADLDVRDARAIARVITSDTELVINCSAYTDVDGAEQNLEAAMALNATAPGLLAARCAQVNARYLDFGTDYVFDGQGGAPYAIETPHAPLNAYGRSKAAGERAIAQAGATYLLARTSWLYAAWGKNFVTTIASLAASRPRIEVVDDQRGRPTSAVYLAERSLQLLESGARGVAHVSDGGECTWHEFASAIVVGLGIPCEVAPCGSERFPRPAARPRYSVLDLQATEDRLGPSRDWRENLGDVLCELPVQRSAS